MSQSDGHECEIDGVKYTVYMLDPMTAIDLLTDMGKMVGPAFEAFQGKGDDEELDLAFFGKAAGLLLQNLDKSVLLKVIETMAQQSFADELAETAHFFLFRRRCGGRGGGRLCDNRFGNNWFRGDRRGFFYNRF